MLVDRERSEKISLLSPGSESISYATPWTAADLLRSFFERRPICRYDDINELAAASTRARLDVGNPTVVTSSGNLSRVPAVITHELAPASHRSLVAIDGAAGAEVLVDFMSGKVLSDRG
jgi:hypothetical protein